MCLPAQGNAGRLANEGKMHGAKQLRWKRVCEYGIHTQSTELKTALSNVGRGGKNGSEAPYGE